MRIFESKLKENITFNRKLLKLIVTAVDSVNLNKSDEKKYIEEVCVTFGQYVRAAMRTIDELDTVEGLNDKNATDWFARGLDR